MEVPGSTSPANVSWQPITSTRGKNGASYQSVRSAQIVAQELTLSDPTSAARRDAFFAGGTPGVYGIQRPKPVQVSMEGLGGLSQAPELLSRAAEIRQAEANAKSGVPERLEAAVAFYDDLPSDPNSNPPKVPGSKKGTFTEEGGSSSQPNLLKSPLSIDMRGSTQEYPMFYVAMNAPPPGKGLPEGSIHGARPGAPFMAAVLVTGEPTPEQQPFPNPPQSNFLISGFGI